MVNGEPGLGRKRSKFPLAHVVLCSFLQYRMGPNRLREDYFTIRTDLHLDTHRPLDVVDDRAQRILGIRNVEHVKLVRLLAATRDG